MIKRRQQEGIALAKERGVYTGRKRFVLLGPSKSKGHG